MAIVEFLQARLEEDERGATANLGRLVPATGGVTKVVADTTHDWRVLAECEVMRNVIDVAFENEQARDASGGCGHSAAAIRIGECRTKPEDLQVLRAAALRYADHPEYDTAWAMLATGA